MTTTLLDHLRTLSAVDCDTLDAEGKLLISYWSRELEMVCDTRANLGSGREAWPICGLHVKPGWYYRAKSRDWQGRGLRTDRLWML